jgi:hypothetical protein
VYVVAEGDGGMENQSMLLRRPTEAVPERIRSFRVRPEEESSL